MNLGYKDGHNKIVAMVYEGAFINGSHQIKRHINGTNIVLARNLAHLQQQWSTQIYHQTIELMNFESK